MDMIDINVLTEHVISRFNLAGGYSEVGEAKMRHSIKTLLSLKLKLETKASVSRLENQKLQGFTVNESDYEFEQSMVDGSVLELSAKIYASHPKHL